ncbi:MAG: hypothetical protein PVSMB4_19470 [Ktedonobacterales bacterium]
MAQDARAEYDAVVEEITATSPATAGKLFSMPCLKHNGKAFAGFARDAMVFKLDGAAHARALALSGAHLFAPPSRDRPSTAWKDWVVVPVAHASQWPTLAREALRFGGGAG